MSGLAARLVACLRVLGVEPRVGSVGSRIVLQKLAYLIQASGVELGLRFRWYLFGPYCRELTRSIYDEGLVYEEGEVPRLSEDEVEKLGRLRQFLGEHVDDTYFLELFASLHYARRVGLELGIPRDELLGAFLRRKPHFKRPDVEEAWRLLEEFERVFGRPEIVNGSARRKIDIV
ncbi:MAG: hypothetical protein QXD32_06510 [Nitrososphaerota archaeon]